MKTDESAYRPSALLILGVATLLTIPLVAMQLTDEVAWTPSDFLVAGLLLFGTGYGYQLAAGRARHATYRLAVGLALGAALLLVWSNLAVGVIGSEDNPANLMYLGVLAVGLAGASISRLRPAGMARTMWAMAIATAAVAVVAVALELGGRASGPVEILGANALFVLLFGGSAELFREAARRGA